MGVIAPFPSTLLDDEEEPFDLADRAVIIPDPPDELFVVWDEAVVDDIGDPTLLLLLLLFDGCGLN